MNQSNDMSVFKRSNKYWIGFRCNRVRYRKVSPENSLAGAKAYEALIRQKLARGEPIDPEPAKLQVEIKTFKEFSKEWFDVYVKTNNKYSEQINKQCVLRAHLNPFLGNKPLDQISNLDVESYKANKIQSGLSNKTINNHLIVLSKCLKMAQEWEIIIKIPRIKLLKVKPQKFDFLNIEECEILLNHCDGTLYEMVLLGLKSGLRFGELIALEWTDVNFIGRMITVNNSIALGRLGSTKSNKIRYIPLLDDVLQMLESRAKNKGFIFSEGNNEPLNQNRCIIQLHKACDRAGMRRIGWHTLRHTFASCLAQNGVSIVIIKELLGHSDIKTTMRYSHLTASATRGAIETLNQDSGHNMATIPERMNTKLVLPAYTISLDSK